MTYYTHRRTLIKAFLILIVLIAGASTIDAAGLSSGDALYFSLQPTSPLPPLPSSLLIQSPSYIDVPAGATLEVYLLRGNTLASRSRLAFPQAFFSDRLVPAVPVASFVPTGTPTSAGEPLPGAILTPGEADLSRVAMEPAQYRLLWTLSAGVIGTPGRAIFTGSPVSFVDLRLSAISSATAVGDQKPGSVLFYNRYTSNASNPARENTAMNLTNTSPTANVFVRLFLINSATCQTLEVGLCLTAQQTLSFLLSDIDPGVKGYAVAVATNQAGEPIQFNWLTGTVIVKQSAGIFSGTSASVLGAITIAKRKDGAVTAGSGNEAEMIFDDVNYDRLPAQIAYEGVPSQINAANTTIVSLYRPAPTLAGGPANTSIQITGWGRNDQNQVVTSNGNLSVACYSDVAVSTLRLMPTPISQLLPSGSTAWFAASTLDLQPLLGAMQNSGEFNGGVNARALSFSSEYRIRVPISPVTCPQ